MTRGVTDFGSVNQARASCRKIVIRSITINLSTSNRLNWKGLVSAGVGSDQWSQDGFVEL